MKKKIDLQEAVLKRMDGGKVNVLLDADIASLTLGILMGLDDIGADFIMDVPDVAPRAETTDPPVPVTSVDQMKGDAPESPPDGSEKEVHKNGKRKPIDTGKVKALRDAGWSLQKIADEMGCSAQNISKILNREKENEQKEE